MGGYVVADICWWAMLWVGLGGRCCWGMLVVGVGVVCCG